MNSIGTWGMWVGFLLFVLIVLIVDMFCLGGKKSQKVSVREASCWTVVWVALALLFNGLLWWYLSENMSAALAQQKSLEFFTGYLIEKSLSVDNLFVFLMIFSSFAIPQEYQRRILIYGVLGAVLLRFIMVFAGTWLVVKLHWLLYVFGLFLLLTSIKMLFASDEPKDFSQHFLLRFLTKYFKVSNALHNEAFFVIVNRSYYMTRLFLALILIEISDVIFALDSIPAIFAVTQDPFIVFTSNIFAILGLRALYFLLADMAQRFVLLKYGVAIMLAVIGVKMLIAPWIVIPTGLSLAIISIVLMVSIILSLIVSRRRAE